MCHGVAAASGDRLAVPQRVKHRGVRHLAAAQLDIRPRELKTDVHTRVQSSLYSQQPQHGRTPSDHQHKMDLKAAVSPYNGIALGHEEDTRASLEDMTPRESGQSRMLGFP